jgi:glycosyltransferase involved in cell wall biosynthesis
MKYPEIIFDAERMKYAHTGIYHYCLHLGNALLQQQALHSDDIGFYLPRSAGEIFGDDAYYIRQRSLHKLLMPSLSNHHLWHSTFQGTNYFPEIASVKKVLTVHDLNFLHENKSPAKQQKYLALLEDKLQKADKVVVISNFVQQEIEQHIKIDSDKIEVIYNGCNIKDDVEPQKPALPFEGSFLFSIGTIAPKKNFHVLPGALVNNDFHLVIAGIFQDEKYLQKIQQHATELGVSDRLHLIGSVSEAEKYWLMKNCSLFIFPSVAEGFGLPVIEAMRFGTPVLLSTATSLPEIGGPSAFYLQSFDPSYISNTVRESLQQSTDERRKQTMLWSNKFSWSEAAKQYWNVYETLLQ